MKNFKLSNRELLLILLIIFFSFISIFALFKLKNNKTSGQSIDEFNTRISRRYTEVIKEDENDLLNFLHENISNEFVVIPAMDYILEECFPKYSKEGKTNLYIYYFDDVYRFMLLYQDIIDVEEYTYYLSNFMDENKNSDLNDPDIYNKIDLTSLRVIIEELRSSHFKLYPNNGYFEVFFDYDWFYEEYKDILDTEFIDFLRIDALSNNPEISPGRDSLDISIIEEVIIECKDYLDSHDNEYLNFYVLEILRNALQLYTCGDTSYAFYEDNKNFSISSEMLSIYQKFIDLYPDSSLTILMEDILDIIKDNEGKGYPLNQLISPLIDEYLINEGYGTKEQIEIISDAYDVQIDTSNLIQIEEFNEETIE